MAKLKNSLQLRIISGLCIVFYFSYASFLLTHYSFREGLFFSFSLLSLLGFGLSGWFQLPSLAIATLGAALPHFIVWGIDAIWFCFFKSSLLGHAESRFHPGLSQGEFYLSYYPLLILPVLFALRKLLASASKVPYLLSFILPFSTLMLSRFIFNGMADPNCSQLACIYGLNLIPVTYYPWVFSIGYSFLSVLLSMAFFYYFKRIKKNSPVGRYPKLSLGVYLAFVISLFLSDLQRFQATPRFICQGLKPEQGVALNCDYTLDYTPGFFSLYFTLANKSLSTKNCNLYLTYQDKKESMYQSILIRRNKNLTMSVVLPYPSDPKGSTVALSTECTEIKF